MIPQRFKGRRLTYAKRESCEKSYNPLAETSCLFCPSLITSIIAFVHFFKRPFSTTFFGAFSLKASLNYWKATNATNFHPPASSSRDLLMIQNGGHQGHPLKRSPIKKNPQKVTNGRNRWHYLSKNLFQAIQDLQDP